MSKEKCMVTNCINPVRCRGLCSSHYNYISLIIRQNKYKEKDLVKAGKILESNGAENLMTNWLKDV